jgi:uncharacterized protein
MIRFLAGLWLAVLLAVTPAHAQNYPKLTGRVVDQAGLLSAAQMVDLTSKSEALEARTGRQFVIATVRTLEGRTVEEYATGLFRHWGIGDKERDDGVLLLVAPNEHKVRIENGYGAEAFMTDIVSGRIIRDTMLPRFKAGDMAGGIAAGADQIIAMMQLSPEEAARRAQEIGAAEAGREARNGRSINLFPVIFMIVIFFMVVGQISRRAGGRRYRQRGRGISPWVVLWGLDALSRSSRRSGGWGGGGWGGGGGFGGFSGGGGFGGFSGGGGWSGGGGASGSW